MNLDITQLMVWATKRTFSAMLDWEVEYKADADPTAPPADISGIVGLSGEVTGSIVLILPEAMAITATSGLIGDQLEELNGDVVDTIGELTNIIAGGAKSRFEKNINLSLPTVVTGPTHRVAYDSQANPVVVRFNCRGYEFAVKYCLDASATAAIGNNAAEMAL